MNLSASSSRRRAGAAGALLAVTGLALAACGGGSSPGSSSGGSTSGGSTAGGSTSSSPAGGSSTPSSGTSSGSGGSASTTSALSVPFPIAVGNTWVYKAISLGGLTSTVTNKVVAVTPVAGGNEVTMADTESLTGTTTDEKFIFHSDGSISYPSNQLGSTAVIVKGGIVWPPASVIASGQTTTSNVEIAISSGSVKNDVDAHLTVKGDGTASVTVPAGTYSATVVQMTESFTVMGYKGTITIKTWVANGVGPVQSEASMDELGHNEDISHQELVSFTKG
jgi:hypothetical protein